MTGLIRFSLTFAAAIGLGSQPPNKILTPVWSLRSFGAPTPTTIELRWAPPSNTTGFTIVRNGGVVAQLPATTTSFIDSRLTPKTAYTYLVQAHRAISKGKAQIALKAETVSLTVTTPPVLAPRDVRVTLRRPTEVEVTWMPAPGASQYIVHRDGLALPFVTSPPLVDVGLTPGRHEYTVQAVYRGMKPGLIGPEPTRYISAPGLPAAIDIIWGFADMHAHQFVNFGFGGLFVWGRVFDARGITIALPNCDHWPMEWNRTLKSERPGLFNLDRPIPAVHRFEYRDLR